MLAFARMSANVERPAQCLNCGAGLHGRFCSQCGQRVVPPFPTVRELTADTWDEIAGWDGRYVMTFAALAHPGRLTLEQLQGHRVRYVSPVRLYLVASLIYFLITAMVPNMRAENAVVTLPDGRKVAADRISPEQRAELLKKLDEKAPWWADALIRPVVMDFASVKNRFREIFPRVLFALVPIFALIVSMFYRRRRFPQHLIFGLHLHSAAFLIFAVAHLSNATRNVAVVNAAAFVAMVLVAVYALRAFRQVYGEAWPWIVLKAAGITGVYFFAVAVGILVTYAWAVLL
jgi:uncharacterized protein DUF3667